ncbi:MAG: hypothetical protein WA634_03700 [Silvibacterium sp.]
MSHQFRVYPTNAQLATKTCNLPIPQMRTECFTGQYFQTEIGRCFDPSITRYDGSGI